MSTSSRFFFGLFVRTTDLLVASDIYHQIKGVVLALDLIELRAAQGTLRTTVDLQSASKKSEAILQVPSEIWTLIRKELKQQVTEAADQRLVAEFCCRTLSTPHGCDDCADKQASNDAKAISAGLSVKANNGYIPRSLEEVLSDNLICQELMEMLSEYSIFGDYYQLEVSYSVNTMFLLELIPYM